MKLLFLGTGAAEGVPAMYCTCEVCREVRKRGAKEYHTRSQLIIDEKVGIDFPPDAYYRSLCQGVELAKIEHLLITHSHMDHFYAHDFILRGYKYANRLDSKLYIYGNREVCEVYKECTRRELRPEIAETICVQEIAPYQPFSFEGYTATALLAQHSKTEQAYVYLLEKGDTAYLHLTDTGRLPEETFAYLAKVFQGCEKKVALVTFDCTFLFHTAGEISRHMGLEDNVAVRARLEALGVVDEGTKYVITHYSHNGNPIRENLEKAENEYGVIAAYDGLVLEIEK